MYDTLLRCKSLPTPFTGYYDLQLMIDKLSQQIKYKTWLIAVKPSVTGDITREFNGLLYLLKDGLEGNSNRAITLDEWERLVSLSKGMGKNHLLITDVWLEDNRCVTCGQLRNSYGYDA